MNKSLLFFVLGLGLGIALIFPLVSMWLVKAVATCLVSLAIVYFAMRIISEYE